MSLIQRTNSIRKNGFKAVDIETLLMPYPFGKFPTLGEFIHSAEAQGCIMRFAQGVLLGPRGEERIRYVTRDHEYAPVAILPNMDEDDRLTTIELNQLVRVLKVRGYEHLLFEDE